MLYTILIVLHVVLAASLIAIVLVQRGPGATMGAAFGAGASGTVFGSRGSASFLTRTTTWMGIAFFAISLSMAVILARSVGTVGMPSDDLGAAGALATESGAEMVDDAAEDDEFLTLPIEGEMPTATEASDEALDEALEAVVSELSEDAAEGEAEAVEPPPES
ncbi:MAG: preprotein translocase subunit SecG [Pseudomonadota bacterium]